MKHITSIFRIIVGSLFIVSGLIKANDPIGFSYKLKDYFAEDVLNLEFLAHIALPLAVIICIAEIILGVATLFGTKMKLVSWLLLAMIVFFTFLTFYSAYFEKVTDCGCFGDALKLTPWQSFYKDLVLLVFVAGIFIKRNSIISNTRNADLLFSMVSVCLISFFSIGVISWFFPILFSFAVFYAIILLKKYSGTIAMTNSAVFVVPALFSLLLSLYVLRHLPIKDFRPYAIGKSIPEGMKDCQELGLPCPVNLVIYFLENINTGEEKEIDSKEYITNKIWEDKSWKIISDKTKTVEVDAGYTPSIHDFSITSVDKEDMTEVFLSNPDYVFMLIAYDITNNNNIKASPQVNELAKWCSENKVTFIGLTSSSDEKIDEFRHEVQAMYNYYTADEKTLQTIIRSNPGLILIQNGVVIGQWHYNDIPTVIEAKKLLNKN